MSDGGNVRRVTGIDGVISGFTIRNPQGVRPGNVDQAIARAAGWQPAISLKSEQKLLAPRATNETPSVEELPANARSCEKRALMDKTTPSGVQMTTGMYLQCLNDGDRSTLRDIARARMGRICNDQRPPVQTFLIAEENFQDARIAPRMNHGFAQACSAAAEQGSIFIMRGVNKASLGGNGVLLSPDSRAPKPMTCHAKSSEFGFTKGLVPVNPQFSRPDYIAGSKLTQATQDVKHTLGENLQGTAEGAPLHLQTTISGQNCHVYQGTFQKDSVTYRYQVAIPVGIASEAVQREIQRRLTEGPLEFVKLYKDPNWQEVPFPGIDGEWTPAEPTLVIGLPAGTQGSQHTRNERYYVSDYDVYAIAHTATEPAAPGQPPGIMQDPVLQQSWQNCGAFADDRDKVAINFVNALLLSSGRVASSLGDPQRALGEYGVNYAFNYRDRPIQHAAAAAGTVKTTATGGLEGFAVPDFPLWVVEPGNVIKLNGAGDLAAYMIDLSIKMEREPAEAILNSKVLDHCVNELMRNAA